MLQMLLIKKYYTMQNEYQKYLDELPEQVQTAVANANVAEKLRELAKNYQLHLDKWVLLENEIMLTLVGAKDPAQMPAGVSKAVGVDMATAQKMVDSIAVSIFKPIREELQDELENKDKRAVETLIKKDPVREVPASQSYHDTGLNSTERRDIENDPYRESVD